MNERIGKFKKISVASVCQRRVQHRRATVCPLGAPCLLEGPLRSSPVRLESAKPPISRGTCISQRYKLDSPIKAQIHHRCVFRCWLLFPLGPRAPDRLPLVSTCACASVHTGKIFGTRTIQGPVNSSPPLSRPTTVITAAT